MSPNALRHPALVVSVVAALGAATAAPAAVAATRDAAAPTSVSNRGLLDGLLGGLTAPLTTVLTTLTANPTAALSPATITTLLTEIPKVATETVAGILDVLTPAQLAALVSDPATIADPTALTSLLGGLLDTVTGLAEGATAGGASVPSTADVGSVLTQLQALLAGGVPSSAAGQTALVGILDQVTGLLGLPAVKDLPIVGDLVTTLRGLGDALPAPLGTAITGLLDAVAGTGGAGAGTGTGGTGAGSGVDAGVLAGLLGLLGLGGKGAPSAAGTGAAAKPAAATPAAKKVARARIVSVSVSKTRKRVVLRVLCPTTAPAAGCKVKPSVKVGGRAVKVARTATVRRGVTRSLKAKVPASLAKKVRVKGGRVVVRVATSGATAGAVSKTVKVRRVAR